MMDVSVDDWFAARTTMLGDQFVTMLGGKRLFRPEAVTVAPVSIFATQELQSGRARERDVSRSKTVRVKSGASCPFVAYAIPRIAMIIESAWKGPILTSRRIPKPIGETILRSPSATQAAMYPINPPKRAGSEQKMAETSPRMCHQISWKEATSCR